MLTKVKESPNLSRTADSKAILNTDVIALDAYKQKRIRERKQTQIIEQWDSFVEEISEIKNILKSILSKLEEIENK